MLTQAVENLLNRNLPRSPRALELCGALNGKTVRIDAQPLGWTLVIEALGTSVRLSKATGDKEADARISGSLMSLAQLA
ncbi:MAG: SCP2 sterol-binding domain-containing protein, partial [Steroidobacteraceae bacterium]|nr:SCP2 sterol-binding domain-containing protein [Steroidobacteraceae bacterium]